jgi:cell division protein FtsW
MVWASDNIEYNKRYKKNLLQIWGASVDRISIMVIFTIIAFSIIMVITASPAVAERIGLEPFYFMKRQIAHLFIGLFLIMFFSFLPVVAVKRIAVIGFILCLFFLVAVLLWGPDIKGAKRWISIFGFSLQPSEFAKPLFAVVTAWILSISFEDPNFPAFRISLVIYLILMVLLILQPDFGMAMTVTMIWISQLFLAGLSIFWMVLVSFFGTITVLISYFLLPHVKRRIDSFLDPENFENYQINRSLEAFKHGGLYGTGPGEGTIKQHLPDSHTDFIFSVVGEELGFIACIFLILMFSILVIRGLYLIASDNNQFNILAVSGILIQIGIQSAFNMGVTLHLLPTKGMTLPLISYGGCSVFAISMALGMMLSFTRKRYNIITLPTKKTYSH